MSLEDIKKSILDIYIGYFYMLGITNPVRQERVRDALKKVIDEKTDDYLPSIHRFNPSDFEQRFDDEDDDLISCIDFPNMGYRITDIAANHEIEYTLDNYRIYQSRKGRLRVDSRTRTKRATVFSLSDDMAIQLTLAFQFAEIEWKWDTREKKKTQKQNSKVEIYSGDSWRVQDNIDKLLYVAGFELAYPTTLFLDKHVYSLLNRGQKATLENWKLAAENTQGFTQGLRSGNDYTTVLKNGETIAELMGQYFKSKIIPEFFDNYPSEIWQTGVKVFDGFPQPDFLEWLKGDDNKDRLDLCQSNPQVARLFWDFKFKIEYSSQNSISPRQQWLNNNLSEIQGNMNRGGIDAHSFGHIFVNKTMTNDEVMFHLSVNRWAHNLDALDALLDETGQYLDLNYEQTHQDILGQYHALRTYNRQRKSQPIRIPKGLVL